MLAVYDATTHCTTHVHVYANQLVTVAYYILPALLCYLKQSRNLYNLTLVNVWRKTAHEHFARVGLLWWRGAGTAVPTAAAVGLAVREPLGYPANGAE